MESNISSKWGPHISTYENLHASPKCDGNRTKTISITKKNGENAKMNTKLSISLPEDTYLKLISRVVEQRKENPRRSISVSEVLSQHLEYSFSKPMCEVIKT